MEIKYYPRVIAHDIPTLEKLVKVRIHRAIEQKLARNPLLYGEPLHGVLKKLWKLRIGDWRVIYTIKSRTVEIVAIGHRKNIYQILQNRI